MTLPLSNSLRLLVSALVVSTAVAVATLILNRPALLPAKGKNGPEADDDEPGESGPMSQSLVGHISELRLRIFRVVIGVLVGMLVGLSLSEPIIDVLAAPLGGREELLAIGVTEPVRVFFQVALVSGAILASPYVIAQLWLFVASGLRHEEQRAFYLLFPMAVVLFLGGVAFAYFVMLPVAVPFLVNVVGFEIRPTPSDYLRFVASVLLWMGIAFELPLVMFFLARLGLVSAGMLLRNWRFGLVAIAIVAALVTPTVDPVNMAVVMAPLFVLYLLSIVLALFARRKRKEETP